MSVQMGDFIMASKCENPECRMVHIDILDEHNQTIARCALPRSTAVAFVENIQDVIYEITVLRGD